MPASDTDADLNALGQRWAAAERAGDAVALAELLTDDFEAVGPLGYVLDRGAWIDRHRDGDMTYDEFSWAGAAPRIYGDSAVLVGIQKARASFGAQRSDGSYRATVIAVVVDGRWRIAHLQLSEIPAAL